MKGPIPSVNDTEMRKQLSKMGRNKACGPDDLPIEAITVVAEMKPELLTYRPGMSTTDPVFALRQLQENCREKNKDVHMVFVDLKRHSI